MKRVEKAWGRELWIVNSQSYCGKLLILRRGFRCSLHYHKLKDETFYVYRGTVLMEIAGRKRIMRQGDSIRIKPGTEHRFTGLKDAEIIEFSTHHLESDSYRLEPSGKALLRRGYDYDGVVTRGFQPEPGAPIITGRSFEETHRIKLRGHPIYWNPKTYSEKNPRNSAEWKGLVINLLGLEEFLEDDPDQVKILEKLCPSCHILQVWQT